MYCGQAQDAVLQALQNPLRILGGRLANLHVHDRRYQLQIVFDPVMHLFQQNVFLP